MINNAVPSELKDFQRTVGRIQTRIVELQGSLATSVELAHKVADVMDSDMLDGLDKVKGEGLVCAWHIDSDRDRGVEWYGVGVLRIESCAAHSRC